MQNLIDSLSKRFENDELILRATSIADLRTWPRQLKHVKDEPGRLFSGFDVTRLHSCIWLL